MSYLKKNGKQRIEVGVCLKLNQKELTDYISADYFEFPFADIASMDDDAFVALSEFIQKRSIKCPVMTQLLPKKISIVETDFAMTPLAGYLEVGFRRAKQLGVSVVVFGNAAARNIGRGITYEMARKRLCQFCKETAKLAQKFNIEICIEPLNRTQSNHINTLSQAMKLTDDVNEQNFGIVMDYFHFQVEKDSFNEIDRRPKIVRHCHTASLLYRTIPDCNEQIDFIDWVKRTSYSGGISFEFDRFPENMEILNQAISEYRIKANTKEG